MDPLTILAGIAISNIILEKGVLPVLRLRRRAKDVRRYEFALVEVGTDLNQVKVEVLGLSPDEVTEILNNPTVQRGRDTEMVAKKGEKYVQ